MRLDIKPTFIESDCTIHHNGQSYSAGGSIALKAFDATGKLQYESLIGYPRFANGEHLGANGQLMSWNGLATLGRLVITGKWRNPRGVLSDYNFSFKLICPDGTTMNGRGMGDGMIAKFRKNYK